MKIITTLLISLLFYLPYKLDAQCKNINEFVLKGQVDFSADKFIYFVWYNADEHRFLDSVKVSNGKFIYKGICDGYLDRFYIKTNPSNKNNNDQVDNVQVPIDNSRMTIHLKIGHFSKYKLIGCKSCNLLNRRIQYYEKKYGNLSEQYYKKYSDSSVKYQVRKKYQKLYLETKKQWQNEIIQWCVKNPSNNLTSLEMLNNFDEIPKDKILDYYNILSKFQKNSFYGQVLNKRIKHEKSIKEMIGTNAPFFCKIGFDDTMVSLEKINKTDYILLDFWATWCPPCRASHPALINLYNKYQSHNFTIIGIAQDDNNKDGWKRAIMQDAINNWYNILDGSNAFLADTSEVLSQLYKIDVIPTKILIGKDGKIIGRYVGDEFKELEKKLKIILNLNK